MTSKRNPPSGPFGVPSSQLKRVKTQQASEINKKELDDAATRASAVARPLVSISEEQMKARYDHTLIPNTKYTSTCLKRSADDEPIFVLCARDPLAAMVVRLWCAAAHSMNEHEPEKLDAAEDLADQMDAWHDRHISIELDLMDREAGSKLHGIGKRLADAMEAERAGPVELRDTSDEEAELKKGSLTRAIDQAKGEEP